MTIIDLLLLFLVAAICGAIGQSIVGFSRGGCLTSLAVGFIGALLGLWLSRLLGLPTVFVLNIGGSGFPIVWSIIGGALFVAVLALISGRGR